MVPAGAKQVEVECVINGEICFSRKYNVQGQDNTLFDIRIPKNMRYHTN